MGFQLSISAVDYGAARVIKLEGFLAQLEIYSFKRAVEQALNEGKWVIIADVERVNFIDSAGIASLIYMRKESIQRHAVSVLIAPPGSSVRKILDSTNLGNFMQIVATREEAFAVSMVRVGDMSQPCELPTQHDCADTQIQHNG